MPPNGTLKINRENLFHMLRKTFETFATDGELSACVRPVAFYPEREPELQNKGVLRTLYFVNEGSRGVK